LWKKWRFFRRTKEKAKNKIMSLFGQTTSAKGDKPADEAQSENGERPSHKSIIVPQKSRESLWGVLLFAFMLLFVIASVAAIGWVVYSRWKAEREAGNNPSITELLKKTEQEVDNTASAEMPVPENKNVDALANAINEEIISAAKKLEISVLNGGAAKGSAGGLADFLKKEGYLKTDMGNTEKNYSGVTIYYAPSLEKETEAIKGSVAKKYPQVKILPADLRNKETSVSQVTIILGK
jgi:cytoskeletal protein RodZ